MNQLIINTNKEITELNVLNYQKVKVKYSFEEVNKRIINHIIQNKINMLTLTFEIIEYEELTIINILKIKRMFDYLEINIQGIKFILKKKDTLLGTHKISNIV